MGIQLEVNLADGPLKRHMAALANLNTRDLLIEITEYILDRVRENFQSETAPDGTAWKPSERVKKEGGKTLQVGGQLQDSYVSNILSDTQAEIGSGMEYAAIHHFGGKTRAHEIKPKNAKALKTPYGFFRVVNHPGSDIPARPALGIGAQDEAEIDRIAKAFIAERTA